MHGVYDGLVRRSHAGQIGQAAIHVLAPRLGRHVARKGPWYMTGQSADPLGIANDDFGQAMGKALLVIAFMGIGGAAAGAWFWTQHRVLGGILGLVAGLTLVRLGDWYFYAQPPSTLAPNDSWDGAYGSHAVEIVNMNGVYQTTIYTTTDTTSPVIGQGAYPSMAAALAQVKAVTGTSIWGDA